MVKCLKDVMCVAKSSGLDCSVGMLGEDVEFAEGYFALIVLEMVYALFAGKKAPGRSIVSLVAAAS